MDLNKPGKIKNDNESGNKIRWFRKRRTKDKENLEKYENSEKHNFFYAIKKNLLWKFNSKRQNKVKSVENLSPLENQEIDEDEDFAKLFIRQAQNPIQFSSICSRDSTISNLISPNLDLNLSSQSQPSTSQIYPSQNQSTAQEVPIEVRSPEEPSAIIPPPTEQQTQGDLETLIEQTQEDLMKFPWYWPNLGRMEAQKVLGGRPNGSFLVRDSSTAKNQFTLSFRSSGVTLHCRINFKDNSWSYIENIKSPSIETLIESNIEQSKTSVIGYVKNNSNLYPPFPVRICYPVHRCIPSLQELCMATIKNKVTKNDVNEVGKLPLPKLITEYVKDNFNTL